MELAWLKFIHVFIVEKILAMLVSSAKKDLAYLHTGVNIE